MRQYATPRAVVFDLGNTLLFEARSSDTAMLWHLQAEALRPLASAWGIDLPAPLERVAEDIWNAYLAACEVEAERGRHRDPSLPFIIRGALADLGVEIDEARAEEWWRSAWVSVRHFGYQLYPDVLDVLRELRAMGIRIGINSTRPCTADMLWPDLHDLAIGGFIDAAVCSGDTGYVKPHPSTFVLIAERLSVPASDIVMVGDLCDRDCGGGRAAGMTTVLKLNGRHDVPRCDAADYEIHELGELLALPIFTPDGRAPVESLTPHEDENADRY